MITLKNAVFRLVVLLVVAWSGFAFALPPGVATLVGPTGQITDAAPTYSWNAVSNSTWYYLWVTDENGIQVRKWYTRAEVGCNTGIGTCSITPGNAVVGSTRFWIQTWNNDGIGPWSAAGEFTVSSMQPPPPPATPPVLIAPVGISQTSSPSYSWSPVFGATWYRLWVQDSGGVKIQVWYTSADAECGSGENTCSVTTNVALQAGAATFWVRGYSSLGYGPWSLPGNFTVP